MFPSVKSKSIFYYTIKQRAERNLVFLSATAHDNNRFSVIIPYLRNFQHKIYVFSSYPFLVKTDCFFSTTPCPTWLSSPFHSTQKPSGTILISPGLKFIYILGIPAYAVSYNAVIILRTQSVTLPFIFMDEPSFICNSRNCFLSLIPITRCFYLFPIAACEDKGTRYASQ